MAYGSNYIIQPPNAVPATLAASGVYDTGVFSVPGPGVSVGVVSSQGGTLTVQRYLDLAKALPVGAAATATITANVAAVVSVNDGVPYQCVDVTVSNSSGTTAATISAFAIIASGTGH